MRCRRRIHAAWLVSSLGLGCGPVVGEPAGEGSAESGDNTGGETGDAPSETEASASDSLDEGTSAEPGVCGDGVLNAGEVCDDGNTVDADGCSHLCEQSGSVSWQVDLSPARGMAVSLEALDGEAYALVQDYGIEVGSDLVAITSRVSAHGEVVAQYHDIGALADLDLAREALAPISGGRVLVGYPTPERAVALLDLGSGPVWSDPLDYWGPSHATRWLEDRGFTLRETPPLEPEQHGVTHFADDGQLLSTWVMNDESIGTSPLRAGPLFLRSLDRLLVFMWAPGRALSMHTHVFSKWTTEVIGNPENVEPRAFLHGFEIVIWTESERIVVDTIDHVQPATPRVVFGHVLTSFVGSIVIQDGDRIDVHDEAGALRWSYTSPATPRFAVPDGNAGLFVISDVGPSDGLVVLERLVL